MKAKGWAALEADGSINVRTVTNTEIAAKLNYCVLNNVIFLEGTSDSVIERWFDRMTEVFGATVRQVSIEVDDH